MVKKENNQKHIVEGMPWPEIIALVVVGFCIFWAVKDIKRRYKEEQVNTQVEAYKKTLPGYLEQQQKIEHYRDSLMNVKDR